MIKRVAPTEPGVISRFREEELREIRRAITGGVWRGVLLAQIPIVALVVIATLMSVATVGSGLNSTYSQVSSQLDATAPAN